MKYLEYVIFLFAEAPLTTLFHILNGPSELAQPKNKITKNYNSMTFFDGSLPGLKEHCKQSVYGSFMVWQWGQLLDELFPADLH